MQSGRLLIAVVIVVAALPVLLGNIIRSLITGERKWSNSILF